VPTSDAHNGPASAAVAPSVPARPPAACKAGGVARRCWLVRAGDDGRLARVFESSGTVALGAPARPGPGDVTGLTRDQVIDGLRPGRTPDDAYAEAGLLLLFRDQVRVGDLVVTVDAPLRQLIVGEIRGDYEHHPHESGGGSHARAVEWYGRYGRDDRSALSTAMESQTQLPTALLELTPTSAWLSFGDTVRERPPLPAAPPRPIAAGAPARSGLGSRGGGTSRPRTPKPAPPPKPRPATPAYRRCPECQMQKAPAQFRAGSEHCVDCRERLGED
jgi:hypothetical protein